MAKALLFLRARTGGKADLLAGAQQEIERIAASQHEQPDIRLFVSQDQDPLAKPSPAHPCSDVTVEVVSPAGRPLLACMESLQDFGIRVGSMLQPEHSIALVGHDRVFREFSPQPICYRYLMSRRADFSDADYFDYYVAHHSQFGIVVPGVEGYLQCYIDQEASKRLAGLTALTYKPFTSISELHIQSMDLFMNSGAVENIAPAAAADEEIFVDREASVMFCSDRVALRGQESIRTATV